MAGCAGVGIFGTVSAVSGDTLTVATAARPARPMSVKASTSVSASTVVAGTVYTVDATNAKIYKGSAITVVSVSAITTGDIIMVQGTVNGNSVTASSIIDQGAKNANTSSTNGNLMEADLVPVSADSSGTSSGFNPPSRNPHAFQGWG